MVGSWPEKRGVPAPRGGPWLRSERWPVAAQTGASPPRAGHRAVRPREDDMARWKGRDRGGEGGRKEGDADDRWVQG